MSTPVALTAPLGHATLPHTAKSAGDYRTFERMRPMKKLACALAATAIFLGHSAFAQSPQNPYNRGYTVMTRFPLLCTLSPLVWRHEASIEGNLLTLGREHPRTTKINHSAPVVAAV
jgi:hypothetical protein